MAKGLKGASQAYSDRGIVQAGWLAEANDFASNDRRTAKIVGAYAIIAIVFSLINFVSLWLLGADHWLPYVGIGGACLAGLPTLILLRKGYVMAAAHHLVASSWTMLALSSWFNNAPGRPTLQWIYLCLATAALTIGFRWTLIYGILTFLLALMMYFAHTNGWAPTPPGYPEQATYIIRLQQSAAWVAILLVTSKTFGRGMFHLKNEVEGRRHADKNVERLNEELVAANADLEARVQERTAALQQANDDLEAFAARVSHDLRAPLRAINGYSRILIEEETDLSPDARSMLDRISASSVQMGQLIDAVLRFARTGQAALHVGPIDLRQLAQDSVDLFIADYDPSRVVVHLDKMPMVEADPILLRQAIDNLVENALKYSATREKPEIWIKGESDGELVRFQIHDNGVGFEGGDPNRLFEPFARLHGREFAGVGLGLATVKRIVDLHGGTVRAMHSPLGSAAFEIALPAHAKVAAAI